MNPLISKYSVRMCCFALATAAPIAHGQTDGKAGKDATPSEMRPPLNPPKQAAQPAVPGDTIGQAKPVEISPETAQSDGTISTDGNAVKEPTIMVIAEGSEHLTTLVGAIKAAELESIINGEGPYTLFAPSNSAFAALPEGVLQGLLKPENREILKKILTYHIMSGVVKSADLKPMELITIQGEPIKLIGQAEGAVTVQGAVITQKDIAAKNGIIHLVDKVLLPPSVSLESLKSLAVASN